WIYPRIRDGRVKDACLYIGRNTLPIYLFHPIFTMAAKFYHPLFAFDSSKITFTLVTICVAVAGSLAIAMIMERTRAAWIFGKARMLR
ncbi:MAG: acyltransferase, partial [Prevotella sp.]|nr:acyltransferase [Prevotella sp.]